MKNKKKTTKVYKQGVKVTKRPSPLSLSLIWNLDPGSKPSSQPPWPHPEAATQCQTLSEEPLTTISLDLGPRPQLDSC